MKLNIKFLVVRPKTWNEAKGIMNRLRYSIFRGHSNESWPLETTIERNSKLHDQKKKKLWLREQDVLSRFISRAHQYIQSPPAEKDKIEWLSLIQDHGGLTRLLDFTMSFYIASYFAVEATRLEQDACVWAVNDNSLLSAALDFAKDDFTNKKSYTRNPTENVRLAESFLDKPSRTENLVLKVMPPRMNERLAVQKGVFLFPCDIEKDFEYNLCKTLKLPFEKLNKENATQVEMAELSPLEYWFAPIIKLILPIQFHSKALKDLYDMNIDRASLFPGIDGFTKSLEYLVRFGEDRFKIGTSVTIGPKTSQEDHPQDS